MTSGPTYIIELNPREIALIAQMAHMRILDGQDAADVAEELLVDLRQQTNGVSEAPAKHYVYSHDSIQTNADSLMEARPVRFGKLKPLTFY